MSGADVAFWVMAAALAAAACLALIRAVRAARGGGEDAAAHDLRVYRDQLQDVERDLARGVLVPEEAERLRTEIARRILEADRSRTSGARDGALTRGPQGVLWLSGIVLAASFGIYGWFGAPGYPDLPESKRLARAAQAHDDRPSQAEAEAKLDAPSKDPTDPEMARLLNRLREAVAARPDDLKGHELLAQNEAKLGNQAAAARALASVVRIKGDTATAGDWVMLADAQITAAGGYVSPEAETALRAALDRDPANGAARFYLGLMYAQTLRPDLSFQLWRELLESSPPEAPWVQPIRDRIGDLAAAAGVDYTPPAATRGPSQSDVAAAGAMASGDRQKMIEGMVAGLNDRLMGQGGSPEEWAQLLTALGVLGDTQRAKAAWAKAQADYAGKTEALAAIGAAAKTAGVVE